MKRWRIDFVDAQSPKGCYNTFHLSAETKDEAIERAADMLDKMYKINIIIKGVSEENE